MVCKSITVTSVLHSSCNPCLLKCHSGENLCTASLCHLISSQEEAFNEWATLVPTWSLYTRSFNTQRSAESMHYYKMTSYLTTRQCLLHLGSDYYYELVWCTYVFHRLQWMEGLYSLRTFTTCTLYLIWEYCSITLKVTNLYCPSVHFSMRCYVAV